MAQVIKVTPAQGDDDKLMSIGKMAYQAAQDSPDKDPKADPGKDASDNMTGGGAPGMSQAQPPQKVEPAGAQSTPRDRYQANLSKPKSGGY